MTLTGLDIVVLIVIGGASLLGAWRGFVTEVLALMAWGMVVVVIMFFHTPLTAMLAGFIGTPQGSAVLAFGILAGSTYAVGRLIANFVGGYSRQSFLGPIDRALGFGFGALKGLVLLSVGFLLVTLLSDLSSGGAAKRPEWMTKSRSYPLLNNTSAGIADVVDRRRKGLPMFEDMPWDEGANETVGNNVR